MRRVVIMGAGGRDFHDFNVVFRDDPDQLVVAFTAAQIPGIANRTYPASLAGPRYPDGIPIVDEGDLADVVGRERVDDVVLSYSDLAHEEVMHRASIAIAAGAGFRLLGPRATMLRSPKPVVTDALRPGDERRSHPGEANLRMADVVVVNKVDAADAADVETVLASVDALNPGATVVRTASPVSLGPGPQLGGRRVLVVEDGPTVTHGGMPFGAGSVAAREAGAAVLVDPRPWAVGSIATTFDRYPRIGPVLPAMGYSEQQLDELARTIRAVECDVVVTGTPIDLGRLVDVGHPVRHASYELREQGRPDLGDVISPFVARVRAAATR